MLSYKYSSKSTLKCSKISIHKEILRYNIIKKLILIFLKYMLKLNNIKYKVFKRKIIEYTQIWCWEQYNNTSIQDCVIPYVEDNNYNFNIFLENINDMLKLNLTLDNINDFIIYVSEFLKTEYFNFKQTKDILINIIKEDKDNNYILKCCYDNKNYNIKLYKALYERLYKKYEHTNKTTKDIDNYIYCLYFRYSYIDSENQQLAIHPKIKKIFKKINVNFELFGSAINTLSDYYCSLFYDIEKYFGSLGNFFDIKLIEGIYWCNPPYINKLMYNTGIKIIEFINNNHNIGFLITIPIWDKHTQELKLDNILKNHNKNIPNDKFKDYPFYHLIKPYIKYELIIPKYKIPYFNFRYNKYIYAVDTYLLFVYNKLDDVYINKVSIILDKILNIFK